MGIVTKAEVLTYLGKASSISEADAALLDMLQPLVEASVRSYLQTELTYQRHVELLPIGQPLGERDQIVEPILRGETIVMLSNVPPGTDALQLKHLPVLLTDIEVREDIGAFAGQESGSLGSSTVLTLGTDYYLDVDSSSNMSRTGIVYRYGRWPTEPRSVQVSYYGGLTASQLNGMWGDVKLATIVAVAHHYQTAKTRQGAKGPLMSESIGSYSYSRDAAFVRMAAEGGFDLPPGAKAILMRHRNFGRLFA